MKTWFFSAMAEPYFTQTVSDKVDELRFYGYRYQVKISVGACNDYTLFYAVIHYSKGLRFYLKNIVHILKLVYASGINV